MQLAALLACLVYVVLVKARDSAYSGVVVVLPHRAKADAEQKQLIQGLKDLLSKTSLVLHQATGWYFGEVIFVIPSLWEETSQWSYDYFGDVSKADISVTSSSESVFGALPHAVQFGSCGTKSLRIIVPEIFLRQKDSESLKTKAKVLAKEWLKHRYGVFDEQGFLSDEKYPQYSSVPGTDSIRITECTNTPVQYIFREKSGTACLPEVDFKTGLPKSECKAFPDPYRNDNVTSSLMYLESLNNVEFVCGDEGHPHQVLSRNKQNALCNRKSVTDVLKMSDDFKQSRLSEAASTPTELTFRFSKEARNRIVVAADVGSNLMKYKDLIRNSINDLIYSLPGGSEFGITTATVANLHIIPVDQQDMRDVNNLILETGLVFSKTESCPECELRKGVEMLRTEDDTQKYGTVILMSSSNLANVESSLLEALKFARLCLTAILFPGASPESYSQLTEATSCSRIINVPTDASFDTLSLLYEALETSIQHDFSKRIKVCVLMRAKTYVR